MADALLIVGGNDARLPTLLSKLGYEVTCTALDMPVNAILDKQSVDLIVVDASLDKDAPELCAYFRSEELTRTVPIVYLSGRETDRVKLKELLVDQCEFVKTPYAVGNLAGRIATQLRLRKIEGQKNSHASLGAMNSSLRDLNERFAKEREEARSIQESLLPASLPADQRYELVCYYQPLDEVGGDWYFVEQESSGNITFQIADVTGHGLAAAFIGAMTRLAMKAAPMEEPGQRLKAMNRLMSPQLPQGRFVTMAGALYEPAKQKISCARAGHPPPLIVSRSTSRVLKVRAEGFALGFFDDGEYGTESFQLALDDLVIFYTDGITEGQNRERQGYGIERLGNFILALSRELTAAQIVELILADFDKFRDGRRLIDDVTLLVLKQGPVTSQE